MSIEYGSKGLVGLLTPQANTTVEPEFWSLLPPHFSAINGRLISSKNTIEERLVDYFERIEQSAQQFANAPIGCIAIACTGASYLVGRDREDELMGNIAARHKVKVLTAATAMVESLNALNAKNIALSSPYPAALTQSSVEYWESRGFKVVDIVTAETDDTQFHPIYSIAADSAARTLEPLKKKPGVDAIIMLGTGMPTLGAIGLVAGWDGPPVLSCMLAMGWRSVVAIDEHWAPSDPWVKTPHWKHRLDVMFPATKT